MLNSQCLVFSKQFIQAKKRMINEVQYENSYKKSQNLYKTDFFDELSKLFSRRSEINRFMI